MTVVVHTIDSLRLGGAEALVAALVRQLSEDGLAGSVVVTTAAHADPALVDEVRRHAREVVLADAERLWDGRLLGALTTAIRHHRAGVVHSHLSNANIASRAAATLTGTPHVTTLHTIPGPKAEDRALHAALDGWSARLSKLLVAPSAEIAEAFARMYRVPASRMRVVPNAPAAPPPSPSLDRERLRAELLAGAAGPLVVCVARLQAEKGIDDLISAAALLAPRRPGLRIVVAGGGPEAERLQAHAAAEGVGETVRLLGRRSDIGDLLAVADAFCLPSRHEGLPLSVLEAMDAGLPVVVTAVGGLPDLVTDGETGLQVPPNDPGALAAALDGVLSDRELAERVAAGGRALVAERFSLASVAGRYAALYDEVARRR